MNADTGPGNRNSARVPQGKHSAASEALDILLDSVSDGHPVDWSSVEPASEGDLEKIRALEGVARIVEFNRNLQRVPEEPASSAESGTWGHLTLLEPVASGAAGQVWRAWDQRLQRQVALKFLKMSGPGEGGGGPGAPLLEEARVLARVRHPGVVTVLGIDEHDGRAGMWMEFLEGTTLEKEMERCGPLPPEQVARIGIDVCEALKAVHAAGIVHRDVKPANIVILPDGHAVLTDFGLGRRAAIRRQDVSGTPLFMSSALLAGEEASPRSDLHALGVTLWWAAAGRAPFAATNLDALRREIERGPSHALATVRPDIPRRLAAVFDAALNPTSATRFRSAGDLGAALREALAANDDPNRSRRIVAAASGIGIAALVAVAFVMTQRAPREPTPLLENRSEEAAPSGAANGASEPPAAAETPARTTPAVASNEAAWEVGATLVNRSGGGFVRLSPGDRVRPGDRLSLEFHATKPVWVYVLNADDKGEAYLLFPQPLFDITNPVSAGDVMLPGPAGGRENAWTVTSRGTREHFLVVASPEPIEELERDLAKLPAVRDRPVEYAPVPPATIQTLRGVGGVSVLDPSAGPRGLAVFEPFLKLAGTERVTSGVWMRQITLENP